MLRESGRAETVGGGEVLDMAPVVPASRARPDRSVERVVAERGWIEADELELLTGERRPPVVGRWVVTPDALAVTVARLRDRSSEGPHRGWRRSTSASGPCWTGSPTSSTDATSARLVAAVDPLADHPVIGRLAAGGLAPPAPTGIDRSGLRELARRGVLVERDGLWWHSSAVDRGGVASRPASCATTRTASPSAAFREAAGITRKHAVPLLAELDARGVTRRRGDLRIGGNRLPSGTAPEGCRERRQAETRSRRRSSWFRPPQIP